MTDRQRRTRTPTSTSSFGSSRRESHDASAFYARFDGPTITADETIAPCPVRDRLVAGDSRSMPDLPDSCISLVVTSPPYFSAKRYEEAMGEGHVPGSYVEYLDMVHDVMVECLRVLEPGGRIAVNVANLGRKPYRSLSSDVWTILEDVGFLPRGEVVWIKAKGASGSAAFGSFAKASNPVFRDLTERILVASKGRFDRALHWKKRQAAGLPWESTITKEDFLAWTVDTWEMRTESATRVGHPAPFPVELPRRLIELFTYRGDVVLDPFMGAGSTALAALATDRSYVGYDAEPAYVALAQARIDGALDGATGEAQVAGDRRRGQT